MIAATKLSGHTGDTTQGCLNPYDMNTYAFEQTLPLFRVNRRGTVEAIPSDTGCLVDFELSWQH